MTNRPINHSNRSSMAELFQIEVESQSQIIMENLLKIEAGKKIQFNIDELLRASHSLKGAARLVNNKVIERLSHVMEEYFVKLQKNNQHLMVDHANILLRFIDWIENYANTDAVQMLSKQDNQEFINLEKQLLHETPVSKVDSFPINRQKDYLSIDVNTEQINTLQKDKILKINKQRLTQLFNITDELNIGMKRHESLTTNLIHLKKKHSELQQMIDALRNLITTDQNERMMGSVRSINNKTIECRVGISDCIAEIEESNGNMSNLIDKLNQETISIRLRPFAEGITGFKRMVRDLAYSTGKKVKLGIQGKNTEVDRDVLDSLEIPLTQLIRNAVDHGIELPDERIRKGKDAYGTITLTAAYMAGTLSIKVEDDGRGIDSEFLKKSIFDKKLAPKHLLNRLSEQELLEFLFLPNFSTLNTVSKISGRGIGLDIVKNTIQDLHGAIIPQVRATEGMSFCLQVPITMSITSVIVVEIKSEIFAIPLVKVDRLVKCELHTLIHESGKYYIKHNNEKIGVVTGARIFNTDLNYSISESLSIVVISDRLNRFGVIVDKFIGQREVTIRSLDNRLGKLKDINGVSLMEDGTPMLVIDAEDLVRSIELLFARGTVEVINNELPRSEVNRKRILVIDDSFTVRELVKSILVNTGYHITLAIDGIDGWNKIGEFHFDLIITDIDMPRLDGFQLINLIRSSQRARTIPVMILSYKDRDIDKRKGMDVGADYYFSKDQFKDEKLIDAVEDLIGHP